MNPDLALALDAMGTAVFALSGALLAIRKDLDIVGIVVLSVTAGLGGGMVRDVLLGDTPPVALVDETFLLIAIGAGMLAFFFHPHISRLKRSIRTFDALGLGFFAVAGSLKAFEAGLGILPSVLLGVVSGVGGGAARDVLGGEIPAVLRQEIYALAALLGAVSCLTIEGLGFPTSIAAATGVVATVALRLLSIHFDWHAPRSRR